ncbi:LYR motif-containing protein 4B [Neolamprologus brichardi]|uniref:LYR motif-containing protein 4B n=1 Tax=Neolamprologus brichardi TaxID=32507 RepID=UPI001643D816|nr:LYR motif-containing protein 4B [Neolamprologus brichardi]
MAWSPADLRLQTACSLYSRQSAECIGLNYALRRVRDAFKANRNVEDPKAVERLMEEGWQTLALIQRQV